MNEKTINEIVYVLLAAIGVAVVAILVSTKSNTPGVFKSFGSTVSQMLCVALSPITGGKCVPLVSSTITFPGGGGGTTPPAGDCLTNPFLPNCKAIPLGV